MGLGNPPSYSLQTVGLSKVPLGSSRSLTTANVGRGFSPVATLGTRGPGRFLPGAILGQQASTIGTVAGAKKNPLSDVANWDTGGRQPPPMPWGATDMKWYYLGGAVLLAWVLMKRRKK